jgi:hypothetical protein
MMRARLPWLLVVGVVGVAIVVGQALAGKKAVGQTGSGVPCGTAGLVAQTAVASGSAYTVPKGKRQLTSWSTQAGANGGQMALVVFRPWSGGNYRVVVASDVETLTPNALNTFKLKGGNHRWDVKYHDLIGLWCSADADGAFSTGSGGDSYSFQSYASVPAGGPHTGAFVSLPAGSAGLRANIIATVKDR